MKAMTILLEEAKAKDSGRPEESYYCPTERESEQVGVQPVGSAPPHASQASECHPALGRQAGPDTGPVPESAAPFPQPPRPPFLLR